MINKQLFIVLTPSKIILRYLDESFQLEQEKQLPFHSLNAALFAVKNELGAVNRFKGAYLATDLPAEYHQLKTDSAKTKENLSRDWNLNDHYFGYLEFRQKNYAYCGLSYSKEQLSPYISWLQKLNLNCLGIIPLDLLYAQNDGSGIYALNNNGDLVCRIFNPGIGFYYQVLPKVKSPRALDNLLNYLSREKVLAIPSTQVMPTYPLEQALNIRQINPAIILYAEGQKVAHKKIRLTLLQKTFIALIGFLALCILLAFCYFSYKGYKIKKDTYRYAKELSTISEQAKKLKLLEEQTKFLRSKLTSSNPALAALAEFSIKEKLYLKELTYDQNKKLLSIVMVDRTDKRNAFIKSLKASNFFETITLIYLQPINGFSEFKLIIKVK